MRKYRSEILTLLIVVQVGYAQIATGYYPQIPCPQYFQYQNDGQQWYGIIQVPGPAIGQTLLINLQMTVAALLSNNYPGSLDLYYSNDDTIKRIKSNLPILYRVSFPTQSALPKITSILYNGQLICRGEGDHSRKLTTLNLEHTLTAHETIVYRPANVLQNVVYQEPNANQQNTYYNTYSQPQTQYTQQYTPQYQITQQQPATQVAVQPQYQVQTQTQYQIPQQPQLQSRPQPLPQTQYTQPPVTQSSQEICGTVHPSFKPRFIKLAVGGFEITRGAWPWLVAIYVQRRYQCVGNLISDRAVLTAAHCFYKNSQYLSPNDVLLYLGLFSLQNLDQPGVIRAQVANIYIHNDFRPSGNRSSDADVAVLILAQQVTFTDVIRPICMWSAHSSVVGKMGSVVGWGYNDQGQLTATPRRVMAQIVDDSECLRSNPTFPLITTTRTLCAGNRDGSGPCNGDSGSGLMLRVRRRWMIRAIVSTALVGHRTVCNLNEYVIYTDAAKFSDWIRSFI